MTIGKSRQHCDSCGEWCTGTNKMNSKGNIEMICDECGERMHL